MARAFACGSIIIDGFDSFNIILDKDYRDRRTICRL